MTTARLFKLGNAQAVHIPARFRHDVDEVEVFHRDGDLVLRPKPDDAAEFFARLCSKHGPIDIDPPARGPAEPVEPLEL